MKKILLRIIALVLLIGGSFLLVDGLWIRAKAVLAQLLLQHAWEETLNTGLATKPWPWADTWPVARLKVARLDIDLIVLEGESGEVLAFGPGHLPASSNPGTNGHCILAGHRDTSFDFLQNLRQDDVITVQTAGGNMHKYMVREMITGKAETLYLRASNSPILTLTTCYPFNALQPGTNLRYIVSASGLPGPE